MSGLLPLIDRIEQDMEFGRSPALKDLVFEVDLENVVTKRANLFVFMHNLSKKSRTVVFRVQSPDFRPNQIAMRYDLAPGKEMWWSANPYRLQLKETKTFSVR